MESRVFRRSFAGCHQRPTDGIAELQIEPGHLQPTVGIPGAARAHVQQSTSCFGEHLASINEVQLDFLTGTQAAGER